MSSRKRKGGPFTALVLGVIFTAAGGLIMHFLGKDVHLACDRGTQTCVVEEANMWGDKKVVHTFPLETLKGARVAESRDSEGDTTYRLMLLTTGGEVPFTSYTSSGRSGHQDRADAVNRFVESGEPTLDVVQSGRLIRIAGLFFAGVGVLLLIGFAFTMIKLLFALVMMLVKSG